jgi:hypothetical protein
MHYHTPHLDTILDLEARHEELLARLEELDRRVETALKDWQAAAKPAEPESA